MSEACHRCLARSWLLDRLGGHLDTARSRIGALLALGDAELIAAVAGRDRLDVERDLDALDTAQMLDRAARLGVATLCRCDPAFPAPLLALPAPPAVLHVAGGRASFLRLAGSEPVAVVGSRRASEYGLEMARSLGRALAVAGLPVVSGMARGIDTAAHQGALQYGATVAVLPGPAERPYPAGQRGLHRSILAAGGVAISELPCGAAVRRWGFLARNRLIAGLSTLTLVVEAGERSGALVTSDWARELGRAVGAVPGRVTSPQAAGPNALLAGGACVIRDAQDVLDCVYGAGVRCARAEERSALSSEASRLLRALGDERPTGAALEAAGIPAARGLGVLAELELGGWIRRRPGGSFTVIP